MSKQGILIVSFGTSYPETEEKTIKPITRKARKVFSDSEVRGAFTSRMIVKKLALKGRRVPTPEEAMEEMVQDGFTHVIVQPLLFLAGHEYQKKIVGPLTPYKKRLEGFIIGKPLISDEEDYDRAADLIGEISASLGGEKLVLMGHGTDHPSDRMYARLQAKLDTKNINALIATVEGETTLEAVLPRVKEGGAKRVHLHPLMLVAGDHAVNDMAGDSDDSWTSILKAEGIEAVPHLKGLGEYFPLRRIVFNHIRDSRKELYRERYGKMTEAAARKKYPAPREELPWYPTVYEEQCTGCGLCYLFCPKEVYVYNHENRVVRAKYPYSCVVNCSKCADLCPHGAITFPEEKIKVTEE
jgi:sirohydrochlorin cobaltochelatase